MSVSNSSRVEDVAIGQRVHAARTAQQLSLRALAERCGLSAGFLSQLERGLSSASLTSLRDLSAALDVSMAELLDDATAEAPTPSVDGLVLTITRASTSQPTVLHAGARTYEMLSSRTDGLILEPLIARFAPAEGTPPLEAHQGEEFAYVLSGELTYLVDDQEYVLHPGDSIHLRSNTPHAIYNRGTTIAVVLSVLTPRLF